MLHLVHYYSQEGFKERHKIVHFFLSFVVKKHNLLSLSWLMCSELPNAPHQEILFIHMKFVMCYRSDAIANIKMHFSFNMVPAYWFCFTDYLVYLNNVLRWFCMHINVGLNVYVETIVQYPKEKCYYMLKKKNSILLQFYFFC